MALQLKLNELVAAMDGASNRLIDVEDLGEEELVRDGRPRQRGIVEDAPHARAAEKIPSPVASLHARSRRPPAPPPTRCLCRGPRE